MVLSKTIKLDASLDASIKTSMCEILAVDSAGNIQLAPHNNFFQVSLKIFNEVKQDWDEVGNFIYTTKKSAMQRHRRLLKKIF